MDSKYSSNGEAFGQKQTYKSGNEENNDIIELADENEPELVNNNRYTMRGISLDLSNMMQADSKVDEKTTTKNQMRSCNTRGISSSVNDDVHRIQEQYLTVVFDLPDGSQGENSFQLGQTVEVLKSFVESEYGIPMAEQKLYLEDSNKLMADPFSLLDYPEIKGESMHLRLKVNQLQMI